MFAAGSVLSAAWLLYDRAVKVRSTLFKSTDFAIHFFL